MSRSTVSAAGLDQYTPSECARIRRQLENLLVSSHFRASKRCCVLLQYVVERCLTGDLTAFKERTIGVAAFGREPDYDTNQDPVVRATAGEVRKRLAQYYQEPGRELELRIALLPGSYLPEFHVPPETVPAPVEPISPGSWRWKPVAAALAACAILLACWLEFRAVSRSPLDLFWGRMLSKPGILFCMGQPGAYNLRSDRQQDELLDRLSHPNPQSPARAGESIPLSELAPMPDRYIAVGDALCLMHIASYIQKRSGSYSLRSSGSTTFADLREHPAVLIGAFNNDWTLRISSRLRFNFQKSYSPAGETQWVGDRQHPDRNNWKLVNAWPDWNVSTDYAVISRVLDRSSGGLIVIAAGITQFGTVAAGEFLSTPDYFAEAANQLPRDWPRKNVQIVIQAPVVHGSVGRPQVLATAAW